MELWKFVKESVGQLILRSQTKDKVESLETVASKDAI